MGEIRPLYLGINAVDGKQPSDRFDLKHTLFDLVKYSNSANAILELAAKLVVAYDSITRRGEVKFQTFSDWNFYYSTNVLDTKWHEPKNIETYAMPCIPNKIWLFDF